MATGPPQLDARRTASQGLSPCGGESGESERAYDVSLPKVGISRTAEIHGVERLGRSVSHGDTPNVSRLGLKGSAPTSDGSTGSGFAQRLRGGPNDDYPDL